MQDSSSVDCSGVTDWGPCKYMCQVSRMGPFLVTYINYDLSMDK